MQSNASVAVDGLRKLKSSIAQQDYLALLNFFRKIVTNIWDNPYEDKFRTLNKANVAAKLAKWKVETEGLLFLFQVGFEPSQKDEHLVLPRNALLVELINLLNTEISIENFESVDLAMAIAMSNSKAKSQELKTNESGHAMLPYKRAKSAERDSGLGNRTSMIDWVSRNKYRALHSNFEPKLIPSRGNNNCFWNALYLALQGPCLWSELYASDTFEQHHKRVMSLKAGVAEYVGQHAKESPQNEKLVIDILADDVQAGDEMFAWVATALNIELTILGPDYNDQAELLNEMHKDVMQWRPNNDYPLMQTAQLGKLRDNPEFQLGITMYNKVNVHFDLLVSRDMIPDLVAFSDSAVPRLKPNDRGYLVLAEQKEQEDEDLAEAISQSKNLIAEEKSDMEFGKKPLKVVDKQSNLSGSWDDLAEALALSLKDQKPAARIDVGTSSLKDQKPAARTDVGTSNLKSQKPGTKTVGTSSIKDQKPAARTDVGTSTETEMKINLLEDPIDNSIFDDF